MMHSWVSIVSVVSLTLVGLLCIVAVLSHAINDNLLERIGLCVLCFGCAARVWTAWAYDDVWINAMLVHVGIALVFAGGAWEKVRRHCLTKKGQS